HRLLVPADLLEPGAEVAPGEAGRYHRAVGSRDAPTDQNIKQAQEVAPCRAMLLQIVEKVPNSIHSGAPLRRAAPDVSIGRPRFLHATTSAGPPPRSIERQEPQRSSLRRRPA